MTAVSTRGIRDNAVAVAQSTVAIDRIGQSIQGLLDSLDRLTSKKSHFGASIAAGAGLVLAPLLMLLVLMWKLGRTVAALTVRVDKFQSRLPSVTGRDNKNADGGTEFG